MSNSMRFVGVVQSTYIDSTAIYLKISPTVSAPRR